MKVVDKLNLNKVIYSQNAHVLCLYLFSVVRVSLGVGFGRGQQQRAVLRAGARASVQSHVARLRAAGVRVSRLFHVDRVPLEEHPSAHLPGGQPRSGGNRLLVYNHLDL